MRMRRTKGRGQNADLAFARKGLADETQKGHCEADGHVLVEDLGLGCSRAQSTNLNMSNRGENNEHIETHRRFEIPVIQSLQSLSRLKERQLNRPHGQPYKDHSDNFAGKIDSVSPERLIPSTREKLGHDKEYNGHEYMAIVPRRIRGVVPVMDDPIPASSPHRR